MGKSFRLIDLRASDTGNGSLTMLQSGIRGLIPFEIKKVLVVQGMKSKDVRGKHAHRETQEVVVAVRGGCDIDIDDGTHIQSVPLRGMSHALFLPPRVWRTLKNFDDGTILLLIADREYDEKEYVREYGEFKKIVG